MAALRNPRVSPQGTHGRRVMQHPFFTYRPNMAFLEGGTGGKPRNAALDAFRAGRQDASPSDAGKPAPSIARLRAEDSPKGSAGPKPALPVRHKRGAFKRRPRGVPPKNGFPLLRSQQLLRSLPFLRHFPKIRTGRTRKVNSLPSMGRIMQGETLELKHMRMRSPSIL